MINSPLLDPGADKLATLNRHLVVLALAGAVVAFVLGQGLASVAWVSGVAGALAYYHLLAMGTRRVLRARRVPSVLVLASALAGRQVVGLVAPVAFGLFGPAWAWAWALVALVLARHWVVGLWAVEAFGPEPVQA